MRSYISFLSKLHQKINVHQNRVEKSTSKRRRFFGHRKYIERVRLNDEEIY